MPTINYLVGGGFADLSGPLANGWLTLRLSGPATDSTGTIQICNDYECEALLDANGNISIDPKQSIWANDQLTPLGTYYMVEAYSSTGESAWGPNAIIIDSTDATAYVVSESTRGIISGSTTIFALSQTPLEDSLYLFLNGSFLSPGVDYTLVGNQLFLNFAPMAGSILWAVYDVDSLIAVPHMAEVPSGGGTSFTLTTTPVTGTLTLFRNGLFQTSGADYTISGRSITLTTAIGSDSLFAIYETGTGSGFVARMAETPSGAITGNNPQFTLSEPPVPASLLFFKNGQYLRNGADYLLASPTLVILTVSPVPGDSVFAVYDAGAGAIDFGTYVPGNPA